jgi:hypothetical protein
MRSSRPLIVALAALALSLLAVPSAIGAPTVFGSRLDHEPSKNDCSELGPCTIASYIHPSDPAGDPYSGGAPVSGVITSFRVRFKAMAAQPVTLQIAEVAPKTGDDSTAVGRIVASAAPVTLAATPEEAETIPIQSFSTRVSVKAGQHLAIASPGMGLSATYDSSGDKYSYVFAMPPLGAEPRESQTATGQLLIQATIEPDADGDGFGDETQDQCPSQASTQGPCQTSGPPPVSTPPAVSLSGLGATGGKVSYTLSTAASVHIDLARRTPGRKVGAKCVKVTRANRKKAHCVTFKPVGAGFSGPGGSGAQSAAIPGFAKLAPGVYQITVTATDPAGHTSTLTASFTVKPKPKKKSPR